MAAVRVLPSQLVNKIAAGEVVERPASVVKELMENSVDAGASRIEIRVEDGGRRRMCVVDDGRGMGADDLALAILPHSTSKLPDEEALFSVGTLGFRGEALASIGSISHLQVSSRLPQEPGGHGIEVKGGQVGQVRSVGCAPGTAVDVRELFFNTPARRKFLRTASTEMGHVTEQVARIGLGHPKLAIRLEHNGRLTHELPPCESLRQRIGELYGQELADVLIPLERVDAGVGMSVRGLIAPPAQSRTTTKWQYFFLNGRYVRDRFLLHALREAFRGLIEPSRHPVAFLWLRLPAEAVDVNVHPTKIEVRFADSGLVHSHVLSALREVLQKSDLAPPLVTGPADHPAEEHREQVRQAMADFFKRIPPTQGRMDFQPGHPAHRPAPIPSPEAGSEVAAAIEGPDTSPSQTTTRSTPLPAPSPGPVPQISSKTMQLHNTYLVAETDDGMIIVDQHALHERIIYEQLRRRIASGRLESQRLLIPETIDLTAEQLALLEQAGDLLARLGIEIEQFGPRTAAVQAFPTMLGNVDILAFMGDLLDRLAQKTPLPDPEQLLGEVLDLLACKAAIKAGYQLSPQEINDLLAQRQVVERSSNCPHGRPTTLRLTVNDLERQFGRV